MMYCALGLYCYTLKKIVKIFPKFCGCHEIAKIVITFPTTLCFQSYVMLLLFCGLWVTQEVVQCYETVVVQKNQEMQERSFQIDLGITEVYLDS